MKPCLAANYVESALVFPLGAQPKIDGVRGLTFGGEMTGRSLKKHKNKYTTNFYSTPEYRTMDGELAAGDERDPELCRKTSSALSTINGEPFTMWHVFDSLDKHVINAKYIDRYDYLTNWLQDQHKQGLSLHAKIVPMHICDNLEQLLHLDTLWLSQGYEGTIIRNLNAMYKQGRSTVNKAELLRIKRFMDGEAVVVAIEEGNRNDNEPQINELGNTFRTSHLDNKVPNGTVGNMQCDLLEDIMEDSKILLAKGLRITVSPGNMDHEKRKFYFDNPTELVGHIVKFKFFPKGIKDAPRFPTYQSHRAAEDM
jgi:DNA ligase-1